MTHTRERAFFLSATLAVASLLGATGSVQAQAKSTTNEVSVLVEGYVKPIEGREARLGVSDDGARRVAGTVVLVRGESVTLVSDPGMVTDRALILDALEKEGVAPETVTHVFISHHHPADFNDFIISSDAAGYKTFICTHC